MRGVYGRGRDPGVIFGGLIDRSVSDLPVETLTDDQILAFCGLTMNASEQAELSDLLADQREGMLNRTKRKRLDVLTQIHRHGLVRRSEALIVVVQRGLRSSLS